MPSSYLAQMHDQCMHDHCVPHPKCMSVLMYIVNYAIRLAGKATKYQGKTTSEKNWSYALFRILVSMF